ncbi:MAG TPA: O-antigen ligase family protein [Aromatoleum sp.]|uniref:O-antigen ligase family protein n=1 Tax=Aromatoleum sp. TaxID=2307007 RepID=UPI002B498502|nr:O-antigen ligase family protein [Aromatoleum sp.]HJV27118.1 O-antigen ligase family protein [Aromatoleum sp.]
MRGEMQSSPPAVLIGGALLVALALGVALPLYADAMSESAVRLLALPALLVLGFIFLLDRTLLLALVLLFRAAADLVFEETRITAGGLSIGFGGLVNIFVILIAMLLVAARPERFPRRLAPAWIGFLLAALIGVVTAPDHGEAARDFLALVSYFAVFVSAFYFVKDERDFKVCVKIVLLSSLLPAAYALVDVALNAGGNLHEFRLRSTFSHPNILAFYLTLVLLVSLYALKSPLMALSGVRRVLLMVYVPYLLGLLLLTQTRSAWVACFAIFALYALMFERRYLVYLFLVPFLALLVPHVRERILDLGSGNEVYQYAKLNSFAWRMQLWEYGLRWIHASNLPMGYGLGAFKYYVTTFFPYAGETNFGAHNIYVQIVFELGAIGLAAFGWLVVRLIGTLRRMAAADRLGAFVAIALIVEYLIISASDNILSYLAFNWYVWFVLGAGCAVALRRPEAESGTVQVEGDKP